ncbi:hypothetical protein [Streptomyces canus]|uniref:hypothetical protein n=1 Tax=Streptomyces canus TaxID=58343 RepID=UPI002E258E03
MPAQAKGPSAGPVGEAIVAVAWRRVATSENPRHFEKLTAAYVASEVDGRKRLPDPLRLDEDTVRTAAHIEALAGLRRLRAQFHGPYCRCDACRAAEAVARHSLTREDFDE